MRLFVAQVLGQPAIRRQAERVCQQPVHFVFQASCGDIKTVQRDFAKLIAISQGKNPMQQVHYRQGECSASSSCFLSRSSSARSLSRRHCRDSFSLRSESTSLSRSLSCLRCSSLEFIEATVAETSGFVQRAGERIRIHEERNGGKQLRIFYPEKDQIRCHHGGIGNPRRAAELGTR